MPRGSGPTWGAPQTQPETSDLTSLVDHRECVQLVQTVEQVSDGFRHHPHEFAAVVDGPSFVGLISRGHIGYLLGTRFGFTLHSRHQIQEHLLPQPLVASPAMPLLELLRKALARTGEAFYHDVPLVEQDGRYLGIIPVPTLVRAQSALVTEQFALAGTQRRELQRKHQDLFRGLQQLRQSQGRYETLFQHSPLAVALLSLEGQIEAQNTKLSTLLQGGVLLQAPESNLADLMGATDRTAFLALIQLHHSGVIQPGDRTDEFELHLPSLENRLFRFHLSMVQETGQVCAIMEDITEQRVIERKMALHDKAALFESLAGGIAHELNNKLVPVLGFSELLQTKLAAQPNSEKLQSYCQAISRSAEESVRIIRQLLQLSRPATMELRRTDLRGILEEAASMMQFRLKAAQAELELCLPQGPAEILADPAQLKQVMINLMINAVDAMEQSPRRRLELRLELQDSMARVAVRDTGHGIPTDRLRRIFDPFFTTKPVDRGTGLGLSVCLGIVQQHQGEITVVSTLGEGTTFEVTLPLAQAQEGLQSGLLPPRPLRPELEPAPHPVVSPAQFEVLVVDDEDYVTNVVHELLRGRLGWQVERVHDGHRALQRMASKPFDLVITDLRMPGLDGFALLGWIREHQPALLNKVLVMTGDGGSRAMEQELLGLGLPILRKPFTPDELVSHCQGLLAVS